MRERPFPLPRELGVFLPPRGQFAWSAHPEEQKNMALAGWVEVANLPWSSILLDGGITQPRTARLFIKGAFELNPDKATLSDPITYVIGDVTASPAPAPELPSEPVTSDDAPESETSDALAPE